MKILYDYQAFSLQKYGGISNSFVQLISHLPNDVKWHLGLRYTKNYHLLSSNLGFKNTWVIDSKDYPIVNKRGYVFFQKVFPRLFHTPYNMTVGVSKHLMKKGDYDLLHATYFNPYFLDYNFRPYIITIHDMIPEIYGFEERQIEGKKILVDNAAHIITVSECSKADIIRFLGIPSDKVSVVYHGFEYKQINRMASSLINNPYILYVGARWHYKRFDYFLHQSAEFLKEHRDFMIVCTGDDFTNPEIELMKSLGIYERVIHKFCTDEELTTLYMHAFAFVYPSDYEGFGMPILEAFHAGCPVLLNRKSCFPEIAADGALYFNTDSESDTLLHQLCRLYNMKEEEKQALLRASKKRLAFFSWKKSSMQLADVYRQVLSL